MSKVILYVEYTFLEKKVKHMVHYTSYHVGFYKLKTN